MEDPEKLYESDKPYIACARCGFVVPMAEHYARVSMTHDLGTGEHTVSFVAESVWKL